MGHRQGGIGHHDFVRETGPHNTCGPHTLHQDQHGAHLDDVYFVAEAASQGVKRILQGFVVQCNL